MDSRQAAELLLSRELAGMNFGLERMGLLLAAAGNPQQQFRTVQIVGTNGKTSTARKLAAALEASGSGPIGCYTSPHIVSYAERIQVAGETVGEDEFATAVSRAAEASDAVAKQRPDLELATQFELLTVAALVAFAERSVEFAVLEAGLGARYDATSAAPAELTVLTSIGIEHSQLLGETELEIAGEKLAALSPGATLVIGSDLRAELTGLATTRVAEVGGKLVVVEQRSTSSYVERNTDLALAAALELRGSLDHEAIGAAKGITITGRFQRFNRTPPEIYDVAHNPSGSAALAELLRREVSAPVVALVGMLSDRNPEQFLLPLAAFISRLICTEPTHPRALPAQELCDVATRIGITATAESDVDQALRLARSTALEKPGTQLLVTGSNYIVRDMMVPADQRGGSTV